MAGPFFHTLRDVTEAGDASPGGLALVPAAGLEPARPKGQAILSR